MGAQETERRTPILAGPSSTCLGGSKWIHLTTVTTENKAWGVKE